MIELLKSDIAVKLVYNNNLKEFVKNENDFNIIYDSIAMLPIISKFIVDSIKEDKIENSDGIVLTSAISYVFNPFDILPEEYSGVFTYIDDCYVLYFIMINILTENEFEELGLNRTEIKQFAEICFKYIPLNLQDNTTGFVNQLIGKNNE